MLKLVTAAISVSAVMAALNVRDVPHKDKEEFLKNIKAPTADSPLTVHIVPHTHDDVGWLKTVDEYYSGSA